MSNKNAKTNKCLKKSCKQTRITYNNSAKFMRKSLTAIKNPKWALIIYKKEIFIDNRYVV